MGKVEFVFISEHYTGYIARQLYSYGTKSKETYGRLYLKLPDKLNGHTYCIPFSSVKSSDYVTGNRGELIPRADVLTIVRLVGKNHSTSKPEVKSTLQLNRMIPVPESELITFDECNSGFSENYRILVKKEEKCVQDKLQQVREKAEIVHRVMTSSSARHSKMRDKMVGCESVDFLKAEAVCSRFMDLMEEGYSSSEIFGFVSHLPEKSEEFLKQGADGEGTGGSQSAEVERGAVGGTSNFSSRKLPWEGQPGSLNPSDYCKTLYGKIELVYVSRHYTNYLSTQTKSYGIKSDDKYGRPYLKLPGKINGHYYCVPLSSRKASDYYVASDGSTHIRRDSLFFLRLRNKDITTNMIEPKGSLHLGHMIPVPSSEMIPCEERMSEFSEKFRALLGIQRRIIEGCIGNIASAALKVYKLRLGYAEELGLSDVKLKSNTVDFESAEAVCLSFSEMLARGITRDEICGSNLGDLGKPNMRRWLEQGESSGSSKSAWNKHLDTVGDCKNTVHPVPRPQESAWSKHLNLTDGCKPSEKPKSAWDKPLNFGQSTPAEVDKSLERLTLTDGAVGGASGGRRPSGFEDGSVRRKVFEERGGRGRSRGGSQSSRQSAPHGRGRGRGRADQPAR